MWQRLLSSWWLGSREGDIRKGLGPLSILQRNAHCLYFSHQASISTGIFKCLFKFWIQQGVKLLLADRARGLRHSSPRLLFIQSKFSERDMRMLALPKCLKGCSFLLPIALSRDKTSHWPETLHEAGPAGYAPRDLLCLFSPGMTSTCCHAQRISFHMWGLKINLRSMCLQSSHPTNGTISPAKIKK